MTSFVLDTALTMAWCFTEESTAYTESVLDLLGEPHQIVVPMLWRYEVANVLLGAVRKSRITAAKASEFLKELGNFTVVVDEGPSSIEVVYELAELYRLTSYDAAYLELAMRRQLPLATLDEELKVAAARCGVALLILTD